VQPLELATDAEREEIIKHKQSQIEWFRSMERNVLNSLSQGRLPGNIAAFNPQKPVKTFNWDESTDQKETGRSYCNNSPEAVNDARTSSTCSDDSSINSTDLVACCHDDSGVESNKSFENLSPSKNRRQKSHIRTISSMDDTILLNIKKESYYVERDAQQSSKKSVTCSLPKTIEPYEDISVSNLTNTLSSVNDNELHCRLTPTNSEFTFQASNERFEQDELDELSDYQAEGREDNCLSHSSDSPLLTHDRSALLQLKNQQISDGKPPCKPSVSKNSISNVNSKKAGVKRISHSRSHTIADGRVYSGCTMFSPDNNKTITCICGVYRTHIVESSLMDQNLLDLETFYDRVGLVCRPESTENLSGNRSRELRVSQRASAPVPEMEEIVSFMKHIFTRGKLEPECLITWLIYVERLMRHSSGRIRPHPSNWKSVLLCALLLSSKVLDDLSMWNVDFSKIMTGTPFFTLDRINSLEVHMLDSIGYHVKVSASEYGKYYFLLRSMWLRSEENSLDVTEESNLMIQGAKMFERSSANYERSLLAATVGRTRRTRSLNDCDMKGESAEIGKTTQ